MSRFYSWILGAAGFIILLLFISNKTLSTQRDLARTKVAKASQKIFLLEQACSTLETMREADNIAYKRLKDMTNELTSSNNSAALGIAKAVSNSNITLDTPLPQLSDPLLMLYHAIIKRNTPATVADGNSSTSLPAR